MSVPFARRWRCPSCEVYWLGLPECWVCGRHGSQHNAWPQIAGEEPRPLSVDLVSGFVLAEQEDACVLGR